PALGIAPPSATPSDPLLERNDAHTWLVRAFEDARRGQGKFTLVEGEAGVGKTALLDEILAYAAGRGARVLRSRCYEYRSGLTYGAIVNALRPLFNSQNSILDHADVAPIWRVELAQLWPEVPVTQQLMHPEDEAGARNRLFEAVAQLLAVTVTHEHTVALFFDDLHEADQQTLDLLRYLYHRLKGFPIWFVCAYRREETTPNHPLSLFRNVLVREGELTATQLHALNQESVIQILRRHQGLNAAQVRQLSHFLVEQSEGNPFVLKEVRRALVEDGILVEANHAWGMDDAAFAQCSSEGMAIPEAVRAVFENRLARLNPRARRLLQIAATLGREFVHAQLLTASGEPEEWVEICLSSWISRRLVAEMSEAQPGQHAYRFSHNMLWRTVLAELTPLQRARLDDRIADTKNTARSADQKRMPTPTTRRPISGRIEELTE
ncbi:MAG: AAA family ATPase, partial [Caldilineaceae bacterium]|nr:AAA family ATPase [Caldilineaceae bacterium]